MTRTERVIFAAERSIRPDETVNLTRRRPDDAAEGGFVSGGCEPHQPKSFPTSSADSRFRTTKMSPSLATIFAG
jgi:hypothetical protein